MKPTFLFNFNKQLNAEEFCKKVNRETEGWAQHMMKGNSVKLDKKSVLVKGTGSKIFDMNLKQQCEEFCELLQDGALVG